MKRTFLGTRGYIEAGTRRHHMHSSPMVSYCGKQIMFDCDEDWLGQIPRPRPRAIFVTHAHPEC